MMRLVLSLIAIAALTPSAGYAQGVDVREQLLARGASAAFADAVADLVATARGEGLPTDPIADKAFEGWAKRAFVAPERVLTVLAELATRLRAGRDATVTAGLDPPPGSVVAAAAAALGRGLTADQVRAVIEAAPAPDVAAVGLMTASALAAQGLETAAAVKAVEDAYRSGRPPEEVLELPSAVAGLLAQGLVPADVARHILEGGQILIPVTPARGPITDLPRPPKRPRGR